jgi:hypothetical protein
MWRVLRPRLAANLPGTPRYRERRSSVKLVAQHGHVITASLVSDAYHGSTEQAERIQHFKASAARAFKGGKPDTAGTLIRDILRISQSVNSYINISQSFIR